MLLPRWQQGTRQRALYRRESHPLLRPRQHLYVKWLLLGCQPAIPRRAGGLYNQEMGERMPGPLSYVLT